MLHPQSQPDDNNSLQPTEANSFLHVKEFTHVSFFITAKTFLRSCGDTSGWSCSTWPTDVNNSSNFTNTLPLNEGTSAQCNDPLPTLHHQQVKETATGYFILERSTVVGEWPCLTRPGWHSWLLSNPSCSFIKERTRHFFSTEGQVKRTKRKRPGQSEHIHFPNFPVSVEHESQLKSLWRQHTHTHTMTPDPDTTAVAWHRSLRPLTPELFYFCCLIYTWTLTQDHRLIWTTKQVENH